MTAILSPKAVKFFEARAISGETAARMGIYTGRRVSTGDDGFAVEPDGNGDVLVFPFMDGGIEVAAKYRMAGKKFAQKPGCPKTFYNVEVLDDPAVVEKDNPLVIVEGECDALAVIEAGYPFVVSVPDGAPPARDANGKLIEVPETAFDVDPENDGKFSFIGNNWERLKKIKRIILAVDGDEPGQRLAAELVRRLGRPRCSFVTYPAKECVKGKDGALRAVKDMNEVLEHFGHDEITRLIKEAQPYPVSGVYRYSQLPNEPEPVPVTTGWGRLDPYLKLYAPALMVVTGPAGHGKALALDTPIPTPSGFTAMGDLMVGDEVFDENGAACRVTNATDVLMGHDCYRIKFSNGESVIADAGHLWFTSTIADRDSVAGQRRKRGDRDETRPRGSDQRHKRKFPSVKTTEEISTSVLCHGRLNHQIVRAAPLMGQDPEMLIPPYTLGAWLGDGESAGARLTCFDTEILNGLEAEGEAYTVNAKEGNYGIVGLKQRLRALGLLDNKHIPTQYLRASERSRLQLLRGLMDTDGHCGKDRVCEFVSINERLALGVFDLVAGLGMIPRLRIGKASVNGKDCGIKYRVNFATYRHDVFTIPRKLERQNKVCIERGWRESRHSIRSVERVESVPVRCIQVDSPSKLFLCSRSMIPTHNSTWTTQLSANLASIHGWGVGIASFEMRTKYVAEGLRAAFLDGKPRWKWDARDNERSLAWLEKHFVFIAPEPDDEDVHDVAWILDKAAAAVIRHGIKVVLIDPWNELEHARRRDESPTEYVGRALQMIKSFARRYGVLVIIVAHPTKGSVANKQVEDLSLYDIADSAHFQNKADLGVVIARLNDPATSNMTGVFVKKVRYQPDAGKLGAIDLSYSQELRTFSQ